MINSKQILKPRQVLIIDIAKYLGVPVVAEEFEKLIQKEIEIERE